MQVAWIVQREGRTRSDGSDKEKMYNERGKRNIRRSERENSMKSEEEKWEG